MTDHRVAARNEPIDDGEQARLSAASLRRSASPPGEGGQRLAEAQIADAHVGQKLQTPPDAGRLDSADPRPTRRSRGRR